jgi:ribosomal protein S18 acetylase RimI-like enzyme
LTRDVTIAPLLPTHRTQIEAILRATGVFSDEEVAVGLELFDAGIDEGYEFVGAFESDRLIGYACYGYTPSTDGTYDLYWIAVDPKSQGSGAGRALMDAVERVLHERNARVVVVETSARTEYESTRRFYDRLGYAEAARLRDFYAPGDDRLILTKRLRLVMTASAAT